LARRAGDLRHATDDDARYREVLALTSVALSHERQHRAGEDLLSALLLRYWRGLAHLKLQAPVEAIPHLETFLTLVGHEEIDEQARAEALREDIARANKVITGV